MQVQMSDKVFIIERIKRKTLFDICRENFFQRTYIFEHGRR